MGNQVFKYFALTLFVIIPLLLGGYIIFFNWYAFFKNLRSDTHISSIPIVGPLALGTALFFALPGTKFFLLPFILDIGTVVIFLAPIFMLFSKKDDPSKGATKEEILKFEEVCGNSVPQNYRDFLEKMGGNKDELFFDSKFHMSISELTDYYTEEKVNFPKGYIMIAFGILNAPYEQLCLSLSDGGIYSSCDEVIGKKVYESLEDMLHEFIKD